jgi:hypothetical protein
LGDAAFPLSAPAGVDFLAARLAGLDDLFGFSQLQMELWRARGSRLYEFGSLRFLPARATFFLLRAFSSYGGSERTWVLLGVRA